MTLSGSPVGDAYLAAHAFVLACCFWGWRHAPRQQRPALDIALILFLAQGLTLVTRYALGLRLPMPWCWLPAAFVDAVLLHISLEVARAARPLGWVWPRLLAGLFFLGLSVNAWMWVSWAPHATEPYNLELYHIYLKYIRVSNTLSAGELVVVLWAGAGRAVLRHAGGASDGLRLPGLGRVGDRRLREGRDAAWREAQQ